MSFNRRAFAEQMEKAGKPRGVQTPLDEPEPSTSKRKKQSPQETDDVLETAQLPRDQREATTDANGEMVEAFGQNPEEWNKRGSQLSNARPRDTGDDGGEPEGVYQEIDLDNYTVEEDEPVPEFPLDTLPDTFRKPVEELMRHYRVPALLPATCALVINSVALGRGVVTKSNVRRTYGNIYAIIGAISGSGKTPTYDELMVPLMTLQTESLKEFKANQKPQTEAELKLTGAEIQRLLKPRKNPSKFSEAEDCRHERLAELLQQRAELEDKLQYAGRLWTEDFTSEALGILLANNKEQMAVLTDDGGLVIYNLLGRYTDGDVRDDVLLCKAKTVSAVPIDRVGRESVLLYQPCDADINPTGFAL